MPDQSQRLASMDRWQRARRGLHIVLFVVLSGTCCASCARKPPLWRSAVVPTDADFVGIWFSDSLTGWLSGGGWAIDGGIVGRTRDGGRSWEFRSGVVHGGGPRHALGRMQFRDSLHGCATSAAGTMLLTDDGAASWRAATFTEGAGASLFDVQFIDDRVGWATGPGAIVHTEDGGENWRLLVRPDADNGYLSGNAIHFVDRANGWLAGQDGVLMRTSDGGVSWGAVALPLAPDQHPHLRDVTFVGRDLGWVVGEQGCVFHTADGGVTWVRQENGVPVKRVLPRDEVRPREVLPELETEPDRLSLTAVGFAGGSRGWAVGYYADVAESVVLGTRDAGATWRVEHVQRGELLRSLFVLDEHHAWAAGDRARTTPQVVLRYAPGER